MRLSWIIIAIVGCLTGALAGAPGAFSADLETEQYDCALTVQAPARPGAEVGVRVYLDWLDDNTHTQVLLSAQATRVVAVRGAKPASTLTGPGVGAGTHAVCVLRRGGWLGLEVDGKLVMQGEVSRAEGAEAGVTTAAGWAVKNAAIQRLDPVNLADNFMRTADEAGAWRAVSGRWGLQSAWDEDPHGNGDRFGRSSYAQNPFAWVGRGSPALCTAGERVWGDYAFTAAVRTPAHGAVGLVVNMPDATRGLLARWTAANDRTAGGDRLVLYRMVGALLTPLATSPGGYIPGQWCRMRVESGPGGVRVYTDDRPRITYTDVTPWRGGVGLYVEGDAGAVFDDITVYGRSLNADLLEEEEHRKAVARFAEEGRQMMKWAAPDDWVRDPATGTATSRFGLFGDQRLMVRVRLAATKTGQLRMALRTDVGLAGGIQATIGYSDGGARLRYTVLVDGKEVAAGEEPAPAAYEDYVFRLQQDGDRAWIERDGMRMAEATGLATPAGTRAGYAVTGAFYRVREAIALGRHTRDYVFSDAPVAWLAQGTWMPASRWACDPKWSFLGGWSRGDAVLWHKQRFSGDQSLEVFMGPRMEYPGEADIYETRYRDICISLCTDGRDPRTGYWLAFLPSVDGAASPRAVLYRNGAEVASYDLAAAGIPLPSKGSSHREWFRMVLTRRGAVVSVWLDAGLTRYDPKTGIPTRQPIVLSYTDPNPLMAGVPAIWTQNNGIMVARARLGFSEPPQPRTDPLVVLGQPTLPAWLTIGTPHTLDFGGAWATSGRPVTLRTTTVTAPAGDSTPPAATGMVVSLAPRAVGEHWYQITATDGMHTSMPCHVPVAVFDPARGRDDSRAVVLYRFDEGSGETVHDRSAIGPAADLAISAADKTRWERGVGLRMSSGALLATTAGVAKLGSIIDRKACTIELWISTDTMYPPTSGWRGSLLAWGNPLWSMQNLAIAHEQHNLSCNPKGTDISYTSGLYLDHGFRMGLAHWVITWDGSRTTFYRNGVRVPAQPDVLAGELPWNTEQWDRAAKLYLGNCEDGTRGFVGTFHLAAVHDRCLPATDVARHYAAGPSGR